MQFLRSYGVAIVMVLVACHQFIRVQTQNLVSWRGGGFGMYASFHPRHHDVWVVGGESEEARRYQKYDAVNDDPVFQAVRPCLTWPTDENVRSAIEGMSADQRHAVRVRVYRMAYKPDSGTLSRVLLADSSRGEE